MKKIFVIFCLSFAFALTVFSQKKVFNADEYLKKLDSIKSSMVGKPYPAFSYKADNGIVYSNKSLLGKKYYINFWFEGCHPCMEEMPALEKLNEKVKLTNNEMLTITWESKAEVARIKKEHHLNFKVLSVSRDECGRLNLQNGFPTHILVDEKGIIEYVGLMMTPNNKALSDVENILVQ